MRGARPERSLDAAVSRALHAGRGARVLVACSGGPDSVALASIVARLAAGGRWQPVLGHVNHGRRASAGQDECVVLSVAERLGCPAAVLRPALARDDEATLREARYGALAALARELDAAEVVTAHTAEDQTETVLLALFRGTGLAGLAGIPERRPLGEGVTLVRPLLGVARAELSVELRTGGLPYAVDPTNADRRYRRNALRPHLGALREDFPHLDRAVARCAAIVARELRAANGSPEAMREERP
ncbi:MAG TPA: tRNA lysidine(34) synthetase TilS [Candidatus Baltobacteraceae bacterium]|nr:tRNA lysidine(34) synthetase TilS [Candidatus Baltobacteraceae bacterium]